MRNPAFLKQLLDRALIEKANLDQITKKSDYEALLISLERGLMQRGELLKIWSEGLGVAYVDLTTTLFQPEAVTLLPKKIAHDLIAIPLYTFGEIVTVAMSDPTNEKQVATIESAMKRKVSPVFSLSDEILDAIDVQYLTESEFSSITGGIELPVSRRDSHLTKTEIEKMAGDDAIIELCRALLLLAAKENASDIHIEPFELEVVIRFRIDGMLVRRARLSSELMAPMAVRFKVMGGLDITERRRPQDGRVTLKLKSKNMSFRLSTTPVVHGEKLVLRLLGQVNRSTVPELESLEMAHDIYTKVRKITTASSGVFFITGPTGSGKTTTLYSALQAVNSPEINVMTIEDPVEYRLAGVNQIPINNAVDLNFAAALRSILRQDPDVILIGEIRDLETAKVATESALTGHLVLSTLHTNDAIQAVTRLVDIGVEPFMVGPSLIGVMSQRLARRICPHCKEKYVMSVEMRDTLFVCEPGEDVYIYRGKGCVACRSSGFLGRIALHEMLLVDERVRKMVVRNAPIDEIRIAAIQSGYKTMRYDGIKKALRGLTTIDEVERVVPFEERGPHQYEV